MKIHAKVNVGRFESAIEVIDAHTVGEFCRIAIGGFDEPVGSTMMEKKIWMEQNADYLRTALMFEPRGHHDMFGAFLCEPVHDEADYGILFMDTGGYLSMCGHNTIGAVTVILETGMLEPVEGENEVVLDTPAGIIKTKALYHNGKVESVTLTNVPSFVYCDNQVADVNGISIPYDISFGGNFFAMVDVEKAGLEAINASSVSRYAKLGMELLEVVNKDIQVQHPTLDINSVEEVEFYSTAPDLEKADQRNLVIFGDTQADRSPCGTGTSAKIALLHHEGKMKVGEVLRHESFMGSRFLGKILEETKVGKFDAVIPTVTGSSYITGFGTYLIDPEDPFKYGFQVR